MRVRAASRLNSNLHCSAAEGKVSFLGFFSVFNQPNQGHLLEIEPIADISCVPTTDK